MSGLFGTLSIANQALQAEQTGLEVTANNIANVNTPGYTRQVPVFTEQAPYAGSSDQSGGGVDVTQVEGIRDAVLNLQVNQETQTQSQLSTLQQQLQPLQAMFGTTGGAGLDTAIDGFFNSLQQLSTNTTDGAGQQAVINAAQTMATTFNQVSQQFTQQQQSANEGVINTVSQVNTITAQIAGLNGQIADSQSGSATAATSALQDQQAALVTQLSGLISFNTVNAGNGELSLSTASGAPLVAGTQSMNLTTSTNGQGFADVMAGSSDITTSISGGSLGGLIQARDQDIPNTLSQVNALASDIATAVNQQNQLGYTPAGAAGGKLFTVPATGAAAGLALATNDPGAIASSSDGTPGSNGNVLALAALQQQPLIGGQTPDDGYAAIVSGIGTTVSNLNAAQQASSLVLTQLQNQQTSESGVSLDQECINLTQFQQGYQAAARVVAILEQLTTTAIDLGQN